MRNSDKYIFHLWDCIPCLRLVIQTPHTSKKILVILAAVQDFLYTSKMLRPKRVHKIFLAPSTTVSQSSKNTFLLYSNIFSRSTRITVRALKALEKELQNTPTNRKFKYKSLVKSLTQSALISTLSHLKKVFFYISINNGITNKWED